MSKRYPIYYTTEEISIALDRRTGTLQRCSVEKLRAGDRIVQLGYPDVVVIERGLYSNQATLRWFSGNITQHTWDNYRVDLIIRRRPTRRQ